jgi:hypothetical protein
VTVAKRQAMACLSAALAAAGFASSARAADRYTFVSAPDSWNADIGDVRGAVGWDVGEPNSINGSWRQSIDTVLTRMASHRPRFALVAGDLVNGHWYMDANNVQTMGRIDGLGSQRLAIRRAAAIYYSAYKQQFATHDLTLHPALGDHDIGDNPWPPERRPLVPVYRRAFSDAFTFGRGGFVYASHPPAGTQHARTAYAFREGPVLFVTVDVFHQERRGRVRATVTGSQLRWLRGVLRDGNRDPDIKFILVQGHVPVMRPITGGYHSSELTMRFGRRNRFWRLLKAEHVDAYLAGEFHSIHIANDGGLEQLVHGSILGVGAFSYLRVDVSPRALRMTLYRAPVRRIRPGKLWQLDHKRPFASRVVGRFRAVGRMRITAGGRERARSGMFRLPVRPHGPF